MRPAAAQCIADAKPSLTRTASTKRVADVVAVRLRQGGVGCTGEVTSRKHRLCYTCPSSEGGLRERRQARIAKAGYDYTVGCETRYIFAVMNNE